MKREGIRQCTIQFITDYTLHYTVWHTLTTLLFLMNASCSVLFFLFDLMLEQMMFRSTSLNMALEYQGDDHVLAGTLAHLVS